MRTWPPPAISTAPSRSGIRAPSTIAPAMAASLAVITVTIGAIIGSGSWLQWLSTLFVCIRALSPPGNRRGGRLIEPPPRPAGLRPADGRAEAGGVARMGVEVAVEAVLLVGR